MGTLLARPPLVLALCQARFSPVLSIETFVPAMQESLRKSGYPDYRAEHSAQFQVATDPAGAQVLKSTPETVYFFRNEEGSAGFRLSANSLIFETGIYKTFSDFLDQFLQAVTLVEQLVRPSFTEHLGIRYINVVIPTDNLGIEDELSSGPLALLGTTPGQLTQSYAESRAVISPGELMIKSVVTSHTPVFPPDLFPTTLRLKALPESKGLVGTLDIDRYTQDRGRFSAEAFRSILPKLHDGLETAFHALVSKEALKRWSSA